MTPNERKELRKQQRQLEAAVRLFQALPGFPRAQNEIYRQELEVSRDLNAAPIASPGRLEQAIRKLDLRGKAYSELVQAPAVQDAFIHILRWLAKIAWQDFTGYTVEVYPLMGYKAQQILERVQYWINEGYKRLANAATGAKQPESQNLPDSSVSPATQARQPRTIGDRLDEAALAEDISHEEQAHRIGIARTTYFEVKSGHGGKKAKHKTEIYLESVLSNRSMRKPD
jgi:hypothetical protein